MLVSSYSQGETNIMTRGRHIMMQFSPVMIDCYIWEDNHSYEMVRRSRECVINVPTAGLVNSATVRDAQLTSSRHAA